MAEACDRLRRNNQHSIPALLPATYIPAPFGNASNVFNPDKVKGTTVREAIQHRVNIVLLACRKIDSLEASKVLSI